MSIFLLVVCTGVLFDDAFSLSASLRIYLVNIHISAESGDLFTRTKKGLTENLFSCAVFDVKRKPELK